MSTKPDKPEPVVQDDAGLIAGAHKLREEQERRAREAQVGEAHDEFYAEPAPISRRDSVGVVVALVALALIGAGGYIWLNPELSLPGLWGGDAAGQPIQALADTALEDVPDPVVSLDNYAYFEYPLSTPGPNNSDFTCPYCGMYADRSLSHIAVLHPQDGTITHHDCWDCAFQWAQAHDNKSALGTAVVMDYNSTLKAPVGISADKAVYLYGTKPFQGSMPPFTAAFESREAAESAQPELGGELVDWEGLRAKFNP